MSISTCPAVYALAVPDALCCAHTYYVVGLLAELRQSRSSQACLADNRAWPRLGLQSLRKPVDAAVSDGLLRLQAEQQQLRDSMSRSWGAAGASPGSRPGQHMGQISSWYGGPLIPSCCPIPTSQQHCFTTQHTDSQFKRRG